MKKIIDMRVLFDCLLTDFPKRGMGTYCQMLAKHFSRLAPNSKDKPDFRFFLKKKDANWLGLNDKKVFWKKVYKYINPFLFYTGKYIIHSSYTFSKFYNANLLKNKYAKRIITVHDLNYLVELPVEEQKYFNDILYKNVKISNHIVCISKTTEKVLLNQFPNETKNKTSVIYNGTDKYDKEILAPANKPDFNFIFFVGWINKKKNVHVMLPILQDSNLHFIIAGVLDLKEYIDKTINEAKKLGVLDRLHFIGPVNENDKHWYFKNCTAFVFPSLAEGFGLPVIEAMHYGKPCFVNKLDALVEVAGDVAYYIENHEPDYIKTLYHKSMEHYNKTKPQQAIIDRANRYSWEKSAKEYLALYSKVIRE